ncbi:MAG: metal ABC transporter solute-binding protein, Zn/Mn family [Christensenellales bacterium]
MKKLLSALVAFLLILSMLAIPALGEPAEPLNIVCTTFPQYDWVMNILGDAAETADVTLLLDSGLDLHSYQPTAEDIALISTADLFIYVGGASDAWVADVLAAAANPNLTALSMVDLVDAKMEETVEGMQEGAHAHDHDHEPFTEEDIQDRTLEDFAGAWISLHPLMVSGELDEYCRYKAEADEDEAATLESYRERYIESWAIDVDAVTVSGDTISFIAADGTIREAQYRYAGYAVKTSESGNLSVRYQFETDAEDAVRYVQFYDHGHAPGKAAHFHLYIGDEGFDALLESPTNPFFMPADYTIDQILADLMDHGHGHSHSHDHDEEHAHDDDHDHDHDHDHAHDHAHIDEHVWLSLRHAQTLTREIAAALAALDADNAALYQENAEAYIGKLSALDSAYQVAVGSAARKTLLFADRFPFRYLADDYGLTYFAAFSGCSAETEASFETVAFLANKVGELELPVVLVIEGGDQKIAETVIANAQTDGAKILVLNSLQSITAKELAAGASYLGAMEDNLAVLTEALN